MNVEINRGSRVVAVVLLSALFAACSPGASVAPSTAPSVIASVAPSVAPTVAPTAAATAEAPASPAPGASASAAAAADPSVGLKIGSPYTLAPLDPAIETLFRQQFATSAGAFGSLIGVGGREVVSAGAPVAFVVVFGFPPGVMSDTAYQALLAGMATSPTGALTTKTISGTEVAQGASATGTLGLYRDADRVVMVITPTAPAFEPVMKSLIDANK